MDLSSAVDSLAAFDGTPGFGKIALTDAGVRLYWKGPLTPDVREVMTTISGVRVEVIPCDLDATEVQAAISRVLELPAAGTQAIVEIATHDDLSGLQVVTRSGTGVQRDRLEAAAGVPVEVLGTSASS